MGRRATEKEGDDQEHALTSTSRTPWQALAAHLHPPRLKTGTRYTGLYGVTLGGELVVEDSRDPEHDLARALLSRGVTGFVVVLDANTGKHRSTVNIEKAAKFATVETGSYPRLRRAETYAQRSPAGGRLALGHPAQVGAP
jgi:hypothetical protein